MHYNYLNILDKLIIIAGKVLWSERFTAGNTWTNKVEAMCIIYVKVK